MDPDNIHIPKTNFYNSTWSVLPMRPKARMLALISIQSTLLYSLYQQLELPDQMLKAEQLLQGQAVRVALPRVHHVTKPISYSYWATKAHHPLAELDRLPMRVNETHTVIPEHNFSFNFSM
jgi:hypothetical protein